MDRMKIKSVMEMVSEADALVETLNVAEAKAHLEADKAIFIDLRDIREVAKTGKVRGAHHVPRGMLEFWIDPQSPYHKDFFTSDRKFIFLRAGANVHCRRVRRGSMHPLGRPGCTQTLLEKSSSQTDPQ